MRGQIMAVGALALTLVVGSLVAVSAQAPGPSDPPRRGGLASSPPEPLTDEARAVLAIDKRAEEALPTMDMATLDKIFAKDMRFTHGDAWRNSDKMGTYQTREQWMDAIKNSNGQYLWKQANTQRIEMHGDVAVIAGRSSGRQMNATKDYEIWYVRVYQKRDGRWQLLSHKTVAGPQDATDPPVAR